ncbi:MAG: hypothetical protein NT047_18340, partial [Deltaproteobacteria bacterium]|nr:hypothetical protein [Deltaproteobacteria bacterium]
ARPVAAQNLFPTLHILASLPGKNSRFALKQFSRRALRCGGRVPRKNLQCALCEDTFQIRRPECRVGKKG